MHFPSKTAVKIFPQVLPVAPPKSRYCVTFCVLYDGAIRFWLFLLGQILTCRKYVVAEFPKCCKILGNHCSESLAVFCVNNVMLYISRKQASETWWIPNGVSQKFFRLHFLNYRNSTENAYFRQELAVSLFSGVPNGSISSVRMCNIFV